MSSTAPVYEHFAVDGVVIQAGYMVAPSANSVIMEDLSVPPPPRPLDKYLLTSKFGNICIQHKYFHLSLVSTKIANFPPNAHQMSHFKSNTPTPQIGTFHGEFRICISGLATSNHRLPLP